MSMFDWAKQNAQKGNNLPDIRNLPATDRDKAIAGDKAGRK